MNPTRYLATVWLDLRFQLTRPLFWVLLVILGLTAWGLSSGNMRIGTGDSDVGGTKAWITSEHSMALFMSVLTLIYYTFFISVMAGMSVIRDDELKVGPILHSTRLTALEYIAAKGSSILVLFIGVLVIHALLNAFFNHAIPNADATSFRGPFSLTSYFRPALAFGLPAVIFFCGVTFAIGEATRRPILIFVLPVAWMVFSIFFLFDWSPDWLDPRVNRLLMWIEPTGFRWLNETWLEVDRGVDYYNESPIAFDVPFVLSRLVFVAIGFGSMFLAYRHFLSSLRGPRLRRSDKRVAAREAAEADVPGSEVNLEPLTSMRMRMAPPGFLQTALQVARYEAKNLRSQPGLYLFVPIILWQAIQAGFFQVGAFGTPLLITSGTFAVSTMNTLTLLVCLLILFYTVESLVRERHTGLAPIYYSTPAQSAALLFGKALANSIVGVVILLAALIGGLIVVLIQGKVAFELRPFVIVWGLLLIPTFLVWSSFVTAVLALTNNRYTTYALCLGTMIFTGWKQFRGEMNWVGNWNLWSVVGWTDFGSIDPNQEALLLNRVFYLAVLVGLIVISVRLFGRRQADAGRTLDRLRPKRVLISGLRLLPFVVPAVALGVLLNVQVGQGFQGKAVENREKNYWKKNVATWLEAPLPLLAGADIDLTLDPERSHFEVRGIYQITNRTEEVIRKFPMSVGDHFENLEWTLEGVDYEPEDRERLHVFTPEPGLAPGDTITVTFSHEGRLPNGVTKNGGGLSEFILPSGVVLTSFGTSFLPTPVFEEGRGVDEDNSYETKLYDDDFYVGVTPPGIGAGAPFPVRTRITGPDDLDYHGVGVKTEETVADGLRTVVWSTDYPVSFFNVVGGKWSKWSGEGTAIFHHPKHTYNLDGMGEAVDAARRYYSEWFYPFPWQELKISEFPALAGYAQGFATNITFSEGIGFLTRTNPKVNLPFMVTAHECAHQWWGNILLPGDGPGANILSEGMAHFSTILLSGQVHGLRARMEFCKRIEESYGDSRQVDSERPLVKIDGSRAGDGTVTYDKGGWVFWMLHNLMGEEASFAGLQAFIRQYHLNLDHPVLQDFVVAMRPFAPDVEAYDRFTAEWFFDVVMPEFVLTDTEKSGGDDEWVVRATIENRGTGRVSVEVSASRGERFPEEEDEIDADREWQEQRTVVVLGPGESEEFEVSCAFEPERLVADPDVLVLQLQRDRAEADL